MTRQPSLFELRVASPCTVSWDGMTGDDQMRFCQECRLNVYNLSAMTEEEARALVKKSEGRLCVRFFQRPDGTVLTRDCPLGLQALRRKLAFVAAGFAAMVAGAVGFFRPMPVTAVAPATGDPAPVAVPAPANACVTPDPNWAVMGEMVAPELRPQPEPKEVMMGKIAAPEGR